MEFWGLEVQSGERVDVKIGEGRCLVIRQACIAASKGEAEECVTVLASQKNKAIKLATLHPKKQALYEVNQAFGKDLTFYHTCKKGSVYLVGNLTAKKGVYLSDVDEEQMEPKEEEVKNGGGKEWSGERALQQEVKNGGGSMPYNRMSKIKTLPAIAVGVVCMAASWVMMHQRK